MPRQRFIMHAEGSREGIGELLACLTDGTRIPRLAHTGDYEITDLEPRRDGTRLVEISGEIPNDIEHDLDAWWLEMEERTSHITSLQRLCYDLGMTVEVITEQTEKPPYYADLWYRDRKHDPVKFRLSMRENNWRVFCDMAKAKGKSLTFEECLPLAWLPACTKETSPASPGLIGRTRWFHEFEGEYTGGYDDNDAYGHEGCPAGMPVRRSRKPINIVMEDEVGEGTLPGLAYIMEFNAGYARRPWRLANISTHCECLSDAQKLRRVAIDWEEASADDHIVEIQQINTQGGNTELGRGTNEIVVEFVVPARTKQIWTNGYPLGSLFLNIEFAYEGDEPMDARKLEAEGRRVLKAIKRDKLVDDSKGIAFLRMCQRPACDADDIGAHVCCQEMDEEFRQAWNFHGDHYGHPQTTTTPGMTKY